MKSGLLSTVRAGWVIFLAFGAGPIVRAVAENDTGARLTRMIKEVKIGPSQAALRAGRLNEIVADGAAVHTGVNARAELTFADRTLVRLGAKSVCHLRAAARALQLDEGAVLFQAPEVAAGGVKLQTGGITASIRGATGLIERHQNYYVKVLVLEGTARVYLNKIGESVLVTAGQMLITKPGTQTLPEAVHFDIAQLYKSSLLTNSDFRTLASDTEIQREIAKQQSDPSYIRTNLVINGRGTLVNLIPPKAPPSASGKPAASTSPAPAPLKK